MKKIKREVTTYKDIYVSVDGKEFFNEADCKEWEKSYKGTLEASWKLVKKLEVNDCDLGLPWACDDHECYVIKPKDLEEIALINAYIKCVTGDNGILTTQHIGKLVALNFGYDREFCDVADIEDHLKNITKYISKLTDEFNEKEVEQE